MDLLEHAFIAARPCPAATPRRARRWGCTAWTTRSLAATARRCSPRAGTLPTSGLGARRQRRCRTSRRRPCGPSLAPTSTMLQPGSRNRPYTSRRTDAPPSSTALPVTSSSRFPQWIVPAKRSAVVSASVSIVVFIVAPRAWASKGPFCGPTWARAFLTGAGARGIACFSSPSSLLGSAGGRTARWRPARRTPRAANPSATRAPGERSCSRRRPAAGSHAREGGSCPPLAAPGRPRGAPAGTGRAAPRRCCRCC